MSIELESFQNTGKDNRELTLTEFYGGTAKGIMLQLTQGAGSMVSPDEPGFIQLTRSDALYLVSALLRWVKSNEAEKNSNAEL